MQIDHSTNRSAQINKDNCRPLQSSSAVDRACQCRELCNWVLSLFDTASGNVWTRRRHSFFLAIIIFPFLTTVSGSIILGREWRQEKEKSLSGHKQTKQKTGKIALSSEGLSTNCGDCIMKMPPTLLSSTIITMSELQLDRANTFQKVSECAQMSTIYEWLI